MTTNKNEIKKRYLDSSAIEMKHKINTSFADIIISNCGVDSHG
jgi:hypothetical protein